jgi:hypothetical protein
MFELPQAGKPASSAFRLIVKARWLIDSILVDPRG